MIFRRAWLRGVAVCVVIASAVTVGALIWHASGDGSRPRLRIDELGKLARFHRSYADLLQDRPGLVRRISIRYRAHDGSNRQAWVVVPVWYGRKRHPSLPLVISPHGRGVTTGANLNFWGSMPAFGPFLLISPEGQGRRLTLYSWGWKGQIDDLARMPGIAARRIPWLSIDKRRIYAVGSSMGGQETLLLVAEHPHLLAAAAALDSATDMAARYRAFRYLRGGTRLQTLAREEIGGTPLSNASAYRSRSPIVFARQIARSPTRLLIWWSTKDQIVRDQKSESGALYRAIVAERPAAQVVQHVGAWAHSREFYATAELPTVLVRLGLIELSEPPPLTAP